MANRPLKIVSYILAALPALIAGTAHAEIYNVPKLSHIYTDASGRVLIKWEGAPNPGPCGVNNGWVAIPASADPALKALAVSIYFSGKAARIDTSGCDGNTEAVTSLYSPGG